MGGHTFEKFDPSLPVTSVKGISTQRAQLLASLGVNSCGDLLEMYPRDYEDRTDVRRIYDLVPGVSATVRARLITFTKNRYRNNLTVTVLRVGDGSGFMDITLFNRDYVTKNLKGGEEFYFFGTVEQSYKGICMKNPAMTLSSAAASDGFSGILPVYRLTKGLSQNILRKILKDFLALIPVLEETLPADIISKYGLCSYDFAIRNIHFPKDGQAQAAARKRLAFEELLMLQLMIRSMKNSVDESRNTGIAFAREQLTERLISSLPFELSDSQKKVWEDIRSDMEKPMIMNRLVLGDVGSGKTVIAELAMLKAIASGYQAVFMAPTEILAAQHAKNIEKSFAPLGIKTVLLTGSLTASEKRAALDMLASGKAQCIVGTHALIQKGVVYNNVGIVITDEQHRFGVRQRASLAENGKNPDVLIMSATPIPRTLALSLYGDMDVSCIDTLPKGRLPVKTYTADKTMRNRVYTWALNLVKEGRQVYVVHPLISSDGGEELPEDVSPGLLSAEENYASLSQTVFKGIRTALIHGKMSPKEKDEVMKDFAAGEIKVLFSTTVIEVGVDVSNAVLIIIENAERFGLAQLHQLRGRVGRSSMQSYCVLFSDSKSELVTERLKTMCSTCSGFEIAEKDLALRGPGDFFGTAQHGLPGLRVANLYEDIPLLKDARDAANDLLSRGVPVKIPETTY